VAEVIFFSQMHILLCHIEMLFHKEYFRKIFQDFAPIFLEKRGKETQILEFFKMTDNKLSCENYKASFDLQNQYLRFSRGFSQVYIAC